jgi:hypothetical protein
LLCLPALATLATRATRATRAALAALALRTCAKDEESKSHLQRGMDEVQPVQIALDRRWHRVEQIPQKVKCWACGAYGSETYKLATRAPVPVLVLCEVRCNVRLPY